MLTRVYHNNGHFKTKTWIFIHDGISCSTNDSKLTNML